MSAFDIAPFAVPNCPACEKWFEDPRDIQRIVVAFDGTAPQQVRVAYLRKHWPEHRVEALGDAPTRRPSSFGWFRIDDWYHCQWQDAAVLCNPRGSELAITFDDLLRELPGVPGCEDYHVAFRRTLGVRIDAHQAAGKIREIQVFTTSGAASRRVRVELDAGRRTRGTSLRLDGYNAVIQGVQAGPGTAALAGGLPGVSLQDVPVRQFIADVSCMQPSSWHCNDEGLVTFLLEDETFTISLAALGAQGPIWYAEQGVYVAWADDPTTFAGYRARLRGAKTIAQQVLDEAEQTLGGAYAGQPRPHETGGCFGCKHARQAFWQEPNGDLILHRKNACSPDGQNAPLFKNATNGRLRLGLESWNCQARYADGAPVQALCGQYRKDDIICEQRAFAVPLTRSILSGELAGDDSVVAMVRLRFHNAGASPAIARLAIQYSSRSEPAGNRLLGRIGAASKKRLDAPPTPPDPSDPVTLADGQIRSTWQGRPVLRAGCESSMSAVANGDTVTFSGPLKPGETCELVLKVPYVAIESDQDLAALAGLKFQPCYQEMARFWREECAQGAQVHTPEPWLNDLYCSHLAHVQFTDFAMPDDPRLINTGVGTCRYWNYPNESCMVIHELQERGLHDEARRRLELWLKYQGQKNLLGNFTDADGVFYAAGGYEAGQSYNQNQGWVLWALAEQYFHTGDRAWYRRAAPAAIAGVEWVFRQRQQTRSDAPALQGGPAVRPSRGWEHGFMPAGGLEDVDDYFYWLSTNVLMWRGADATAAALEAIGHPEAPRVRRQADAFAADLRRGLEISRQRSPLVRLRDGRWVGHYPPRLYRRGRDVGWIRQVLEGDIYLLLGGLYDARSPRARDILDDYQDNLYMDPPFGYPLTDVAAEWFDRGGFSIQPNLLAGLLPYLDVDQPEVYDWMFFNAFAACYRREVNAIAEHPMPCLGFSNIVPVKTSDEANAVSWLRYMFVWSQGDRLYLGRAIPRHWQRDGEIYATGVSTHFGQVSVTLRSQAANGLIELCADLSLRHAPSKILARIRHPGALPIRSVTVNGKAHGALDARTGDIDVTGLTGRIRIEARY